MLRVKIQPRDILTCALSLVGVKAPNARRLFEAIHCTAQHHNEITYYNEILLNPEFHKSLGG